MNRTPPQRRLGRSEEQVYATSSEKDRIEFLVQRDGPKAAAEWVARTLAIYREAVATPASHASIPDFRPRFDAAIREFEEWLSRHGEPRAR